MTREVAVVGEVIQLPWTKAGRGRGRRGLGDVMPQAVLVFPPQERYGQCPPFRLRLGAPTQLPGVFGPRLRPGVTVVATPASPHPVRASLELSTTEEKPQSRDQLRGLALSRTRL